jgi:hypothetical protein
MTITELLQSCTDAELRQMWEDNQNLLVREYTGKLKEIFDIAERNKYLYACDTIDDHIKDEVFRRWLANKLA